MGKKKKVKLKKWQERYFENAKQNITMQKIIDKTKPLPLKREAESDSKKRG